MDRFSYWEEMTGQSRKVARKYAIILCRLCGEKTRDTRSKRTLTEVDLRFWRTTLIFNYHAFTKERSIEDLESDTHDQIVQWLKLTKGLPHSLKLRCWRPFSTINDGFYGHFFNYNLRIRLNITLTKSYQKINRWYLGDIESYGYEIFGMR